MKLEFSGAARTVTGSKHLLTVNGKNILMDCGLFQGRRRQSIIANTKFPFDIQAIDAVVLSHAHIDHSGALPILAKEGYDGPIYCTHATRDLCSIMLKDAGYIQEKDAEWMRKKLKNPEAEPLYTIQDAQRVMGNFRSVAYKQRFEVVKGVWVTFHDAGHILGSALEEWEIEDWDTKTDIRMGFTGDLGRKNLPILKDREQLKNLDILVTESTYGDRLHEEIGDVELQVAETIRRTVERGGSVIVPSFAVGRTQELLYVLHGLIEQKKIPKIPIFVDSPLAKAATEIVGLHKECFDEELQDMFARGIDPFYNGNGVQFTESVEESKALNDFPQPCIILSASGMCEAGRIRHHLANRISDPRNTIMVVGWMAENTLGRKIVDKEKLVNIFGEPYPVYAEVVKFNAFSGHADQRGLLDFASRVGNPSTVFCVHGEFEQTKTFREKLLELPNMQKSKADIFIPSPGDMYDLHEKKIMRQMVQTNEISRSLFPEFVDAEI